MKLDGKWDGKGGVGEWGGGKDIRKTELRKKEIDKNCLCFSKVRIYPGRIFSKKYHNLTFFIN